MAIQGYNQLMTVDTEIELNDITSGPLNGSPAFANDTAHFYVFYNAVWYKVPNTTEVTSWIAAKTANRTYINGIAQNGTAQTGDIVEWITTLTTSGGTVTDYVTTQGATRTSSGTALLSSIFPDSIQTNFIDSTGVYAQGSPTVTSNKTVSISFTKQSITGVVVLTINVLGAASMATIPDGVTVKTRLVGIAA